MKIINPLKITSSNISSSNLEDENLPAYMAGSTYSKGQQVILTETKGVFEALKDNVQSKPVKETSNLDWLYIGKTNSWRLFDNKVGSLSERQSFIEVSIIPKRVINSVALFNISASKVTIRMVDPNEGEVYSNGNDLYDQLGINNWYDYFFTPISRSSDITFLDLPPYSNAEIKIRIEENDPSAIAKIGLVVIGKQETIGWSQYGSSVGRTDYSIKSTDEFGNSTITKRKSVKRGSFDIKVETSRVDYITKFLDNLRATELVFIGEEKYESTIIYGFYRDLDTVFGGPTLSDCSLEITGL